MTFPDVLPDGGGRGGSAPASHTFIVVESTIPEGMTLTYWRALSKARRPNRRPWWRRICHA